MKKFQKIVSVLLLGLLLVSCGSPTPSDQVKKDLDDFKKNSLDDLLREMGEGEGEALFRFIVNHDEYANAFYNKVMDFEYEITGETISEDGNSADVSVTITTYPFGQTVVESMTELTVQALFGAVDFEEAVVQKFLDLSDKSYSKAIVIHCTKTKKGWTTDLHSSEDFADALTGGTITGIKALEGIVENEYADTGDYDDHYDHYDYYEGMTFDDYLQTNPDVVWQLESTLFNDGFKGEYATNENTLYFLVDLDSMVEAGHAEDEEFLSMIRETYDSQFEIVESDVCKQIAEIESATEFSGVSVEVLIIIRRGRYL